MNLRIFASITALMLSSAPGAQLDAQVNQPQHYTIIQLGSLGGTSFVSGDMTINDRAWVDSASNLLGDQSHHAFVWINGTMTDLGTLGGPNSNIGQMNDRGDITVGGADTGMSPELSQYCPTKGSPAFSRGFQSPRLVLLCRCNTDR